jgi:hypothetical protein
MKPGLRTTNRSCHPEERSDEGSGLESRRINPEVLRFAQDDVCSVILRPDFLAEGSRLAPNGRRINPEVLRFAQDDKSEVLPSLCSGCCAIALLRATKTRSFASLRMTKAGCCAIGHETRPQDDKPRSFGQKSGLRTTKATKDLALEGAKNLAFAFPPKRKETKN